jgi:hypothetical protein
MRITWLLLTLACGVPGQVALAQWDFREAVPLSLTLRYDQVTDPATHQAVLETAREFPLTQVFPQLSAQSRLSVLRLAAGARFADHLDTRPRFQVGVLDLEVYQSNVGLGLTLLDYDRTGVPDLHARWLLVRGGPAFRIGSDAAYLEPRLTGSAGLTTLHLGLAHYARLGPQADAGNTHLEGRYQFTLTARLGRLTLAADYGRSLHLGGINTRRNLLGAEAFLTVHHKAQAFARYEQEATRLGNRTQERDHLRLGLRLTPRATRY